MQAKQKNNDELNQSSSPHSIYRPTPQKGAAILYELAVSYFGFIEYCFAVNHVAVE